MKGFIYARESSGDTNIAPPIEGQIEIGKKWFAEQGHELIAIFADNGWSGGDWRRPEWNRMVEETKPRKVDFIWTWAQDRLARDVEQFRWFYRNLREKDCRVFAGNDEIDMNTVGGIAKHTSLAMADEIMRVQTSEKVKRVYLHKLKIAKKNKIRINWGRQPISIEIEQEAIRLAKESPRLTVRQITALLPNYRLISKKTPTYRKPSIGWVAQTIKAYRVQQYPSKSREVKSSDNYNVQNNPIDEH